MVLDLGKDIILYFKVLGLYPEFGNSTFATAFGIIDFGKMLLFDMMVMNWMQHKIHFIHFIINISYI